MKKLIVLSAMILFIISLTIFCWPFLHHALYDLHIKHEIRAFNSDIHVPDEPAEEPENTKPASSDYDLQELYDAMQTYNKQLYETGQSGLVDQLSYEKPDFFPQDFGIDTPLLGSIRIPALEIELPIYNGASEENMAEGAVYLAKTSLPIGGNNTNTVIAAHTRYRGYNMFRYLPQLQKGDDIYITNFWGTLHYQVTDSCVIFPNEFEKVYIQPERDLLTLSTCYPYPHNYQRYLIYADRCTN